MFVPLAVGFLCLVLPGGVIFQYSVDTFCDFVAVGPTDSASLAACEALLQEYLPTLKALPNATVSRIVCGGCGDFKVVVTQPAADHGAWGSKGFAPEQEFLAKLEAIDGVCACLIGGIPLSVTVQRVGLVFLF